MWTTAETSEKSPSHSQPRKNEKCHDPGHLGTCRRIANISSPPPRAPCPRIVFTLTDLVYRFGTLKRMRKTPMRYAYFFITFTALSFFRCLTSQRDDCENYGGCWEPNTALFIMTACNADTSRCSDPAYLQKQHQSEKQCLDFFAGACAIGVLEYHRVMSKSGKPGSGGIGSPI